MVRIHLLFLLVFLVPQLAAGATKEQSLQEVYRSIRQAQHDSQYPFHIISDERGDILSANVFMLLDIPYRTFRERLQEPRNWCDFLILHLNIKSCVKSEAKGRQYLTLYAGRKNYQPPEITYQLKYLFTFLENRASFFEALMTAEQGPMRTRDYQIRVQAMPYRSKTLVRLGMQYERSFFSKGATYTYLNTLGRNKIGFTVVGQDDEGKPVYIDGVKAVIERNVMRYFLAVSVYLESSSKAGGVAFRTLLERWFDATEHYHDQLYEYDKQTYIKAKLQERLNQQELQQAVDIKRMKRRAKSG